MSKTDLTGQKKYYDSHNLKTEEFGFHRASTVVQLASQFIKNRKVLEVGCGLGYLASKLYQLAKEYTAIDISEKSINKAKTRYPDIDFVVRDVSDMPLEYFDLILFSDSLEHIQDWRGTLQKSLNMAGIVIINTNIADCLKFVKLNRSRFVGFSEQPIDHLIYLDDVLEVTRKEGKDLLFYQVYGIELERQYQFMVIA